MKVLAICLFVLIPGSLIGGAIWAVLAWQLTGWGMGLLTFGALILSTLVSLALYWFVWPHPSSELDEDDDD